MSPRNGGDCESVPFTADPEKAWEEEVHPGNKKAARCHFLQNVPARGGRLYRIDIIGHSSIWDCELHDRPVNHIAPDQKLFTL